MVGVCQFFGRSPKLVIPNVRVRNLANASRAVLWPNDLVKEKDLDAQARCLVSTLGMTFWAKWPDFLSRLKNWQTLGGVAGSFCFLLNALCTRKSERLSGRDGDLLFICVHLCPICGQRKN
jgi:hypothetical protein